MKIGEISFKGVCEWKRFYEKLGSIVMICDYLSPLGKFFSSYFVSEEEANRFLEEAKNLSYYDNRDDLTILSIQGFVRLVVSYMNSVKPQGEYSFKERNFFQ